MTVIYKLINHAMFVQQEVQKKLNYGRVQKVIYVARHSVFIHLGDAAMCCRPLVVHCMNQFILNASSVYFLAFLCNRGSGERRMQEDLVRVPRIQRQEL